MAYPAASGTPLSHASQESRLSYLKSVAGLTFLGLTISGITGIISALTVAQMPIFTTRWGSLALIFGSFGIANYVAPRFVFGGQKWLGFLMGAVFQGVAMGYLLLMAFVMGAAAGDPLVFIGNALGMTALTCVGILAYLWSGPQELSLVKAGLSAMFLPMLILMGVTAVFPIGGAVGIGISLLFVVISVAGLLYQMNTVLHQMSTDMKVEGAYTITMGVLILFWNLLSLILSLSGRD